MPNYYEILQIIPAATLDEIEATYDAQYHHWRQLVTCHAPDVVNRAN